MAMKRMTFMKMMMATLVVYWESCHLAGCSPEDDAEDDNNAHGDHDDVDDDDVDFGCLLRMALPGWLQSWGGSRRPVLICTTAGGLDHPVWWWSSWQRWWSAWRWWSSWWRRSWWYWFSQLPGDKTTLPKIMKMVGEVDKNKNQPSRYRGGRCSNFLTMRCFNDAMFSNS